MPLDFTYRGAAEAEAWVILQYDPDLLDVCAPDNVYHEHQLYDRIQQAQIDLTESQQEQARLALEYPYRPDLASLPATFRGLRSGDAKSLTLGVSVKSAAVDSAKIIVKAIAPSPATPAALELARPAQTYIRHPVDVTIRTFDLVVAGPSGSWTASGDELTLHPFPNRVTSYRFGVVNNGVKDREVKLRFLTPNEPLDLKELSPAATADLLNSLTAADEKFTVNVPVPAGTRRFAPAAEKADEKGDAAKQATAAAAPTVAKADEAAATGGEPAPPQGPAILHGLLAELSDSQDAKQKYFKQIKVVPQRPRRYVRPRVGYNARLERIDVSVTARDSSLLPPDPVVVECEIAEDLAAGSQGKLRDTIDAKKPRANLFVNVPATPPQQVTLYLHVDGFPRAFVYRVLSGAESVDLPEVTDLTEVRLIQPETIAGFQAPAATTPVEIQVDAPVGSFEDGNDYVEVQLDENQDGQLETESAIRFTLDRQATSYLESFAAGTLSLDTRVGDFRVPLPTQRLQNVNVKVLGEVGVKNIAHKVDPLTLRIDGAPPRIHRVSLKPASGTIVTGAELEVSVWVRDAMSGVKRVEVAFDTDGTEKITPQTQLTKAVFDPFTKRWTAKLATEKILGWKTLLVQATDRVDITSEVFTVPVLVVTPEQIATLVKTQPKVLQGIVTFENRSIADVEMTLTDPAGQVVATDTTNERGGFVFAEVAPGTYSVSARGVIYNVPRQGSKKVVIAPEAGGVVQADIELR